MSPLNPPCTPKLLFFLMIPRPPTSTLSPYTALFRSFTPTAIVAGNTSTLTFTITNPNGKPPQSGLHITGNQPTNETVFSATHTTHYKQRLPPHPKPHHPPPAGPASWPAIRPRPTAPN